MINVDNSNLNLPWIFFYWNDDQVIWCCWVLQTSYESWHTSRNKPRSFNPQTSSLPPSKFKWNSGVHHPNNYHTINFDFRIVRLKVIKCKFLDRNQMTLCIIPLKWKLPQEQFTVLHHFKSMLLHFVKALLVMNEREWQYWSEVFQLMGMWMMKGTVVKSVFFIHSFLSLERISTTCTHFHRISYPTQRILSKYLITRSWTCQIRKWAILFF